jgi:hypothetical protein
MYREKRESQTLGVIEGGEANGLGWGPYNCASQLPSTCRWQIYVYRYILTERNYILYPSEDSEEGRS